MSVMLSPVKLFAHGPAAFGIYLGFLVALHFILTPAFPAGLNTPGIDPTQEFFIVFFAEWVYRPDPVQDILFVTFLAGGLLLTAALCSRGTNIAIVCSISFFGAFFFLYFTNKYAMPFLTLNLPAILPSLIANVLILSFVAAGWSTLLDRKYNPKAAPPPEHWTTIETTCPSCGAKFKSNPKYCAACSAILRE